MGGLREMGGWRGGVSTMPLAPCSGGDTRAPYPHCTATRKAGGKGTSRTDRPLVCTNHCTKEPARGHRVGDQQQRVEAKSMGGRPKRMGAMGAQGFSRCTPRDGHDTAWVSWVSPGQAVPCCAVRALCGATGGIWGGNEQFPGCTSAQAVREGFLLQNIHLVARWLGTLEKMVEQYSLGSHADYRVFMSAEPAPSPEAHIIPQGLLENAIKITNEPPTGMYANLHKALDLFTQVPSLHRPAPPHRGRAAHSRLRSGGVGACGSHRARGFMG